MKTQHIAIAGGGIGGLSAALALARAGQRVTMLEQTAEFAEVGAGIQLGPNAMKVLAAWGLRDAVLAQACLPEAIAVRDAMSGRGITRILLGRAVQQRYGEVYATIHRADLHQVLLSAVQREAHVQLHTHTALLSVQSNADGLALQTSREPLQAQALVGADGLWSRVREHVVGDGPPHFTGHVAYRSLLPRDALPSSTSLNEISVWWAPKLHVVGYPVRGGALYNLVVLAEGAALGEGWNFEASAPKVQALLGHSSADLQALTSAAKDWRAWPLYQRKPRTPWSRGPVTLLGDAAHPMLPYLAQGAAMAMEDAAALAHSVSSQANFEAAFQHYEHMRYQRTAKVVQTAQRNAWIFHASGVTRMARDEVLALKGTEVLGMPWLYGFNAGVQ
jgi:salicylate hydroxylase